MNNNIIFILVTEVIMLALTYGNVACFFGGTYGNEITIKNTIGTKYQYIARRKKLWEYVAISAVKK